MNNVYDAKKVEKRWQDFWEKEKIFRFNAGRKGKLFSIDTPPPTVSGKMHIGHAFSYSHEDFIARYKRMRGFNVWFPFGTDDNGLPTERLVERLKGVRASEMRRDDFIKLCLKTLEEIKAGFINDWKVLGMSCDFSDVYSTIDNKCRKISQMSFLDLYKKGLVYQEESPVSWCTTCNTAIAQAEFEDRQVSSHFNDIVFFVDGKELIISTTRPELLAACVAVFVNPGDKRRRGLVGKKAKVPLFDYYVPILEDERVDIEKGTGVVMCCTFGDTADVEWWRRYKLPLKVAVTAHGLMSDEAGKYKGLTVKKARAEIVNDLEKSGLLRGRKQVVHNLNVHDKCGTELEILKTKQWYIEILDNKRKLIEEGKKIRWFPEFMLKRYVNWVENLQWDWCISRQRFFGVPFPVWYCKKCGGVVLAEERDLPVDPLYDKPKKKCKCGGGEFIGEKDVMDTWATSSTTPMILNGFNGGGLPMSLRPQAHDIIRTWAFYTIVKGYYHFKKIPWEDVMISGFVTLEGEKMSKSKGNTIEPADVLGKYGADALRFWAASGKLGEDTDYMEKEVMAGKRTVVKLWNASRFCIMNLKGYKFEKPRKLLDMDKWVLSKLNRLIKESTEYFENYDYSKNKMEVENFFWNLFCDNYLEIVKGRLYSGNKEEKLSAQYALYTSLIGILKLLAPIMPHITEEIWSLYFREMERVKSIHLSGWPEYDKKLEDEHSENIGDLFVGILGKVRKFKTENKMALNREVKLVLVKKDFEMLRDAMDDLKAATRAREINVGEFRIEM